MAAPDADPVCSGGFEAGEPFRRRLDEVVASIRERSAERLKGDYGVEIR